MRSSLGGAVFSSLLLAAAAAAQQDPKPGFNLFSVEQDVEIGRQSAAEAERELPVLADASLERYLNKVVRVLAEQAPGASYPYQARVVNARDINAFTFPGGFLYVNRGLLEAARTESELAGVLGHEVAHVALRHGTHQASKAYAANAGLGILGGLLGGDGGGDTGKILQVIGGVGLNAVFLKFSRSAEYEADLVGVRMLRRAGYDPGAMSDFFELLQQQQRRDPGKLEQFFSSHPAPGDRAERMRAEAGRLGSVARPREVGGFEAVRAELRGQPSTSSRTGRLRDPDRRSDPGWGRPRAVRVEPASTRWRTFRQRGGFYEIHYPDNWSAHPAERGYGVVIAPSGGILEADGQQAVVYGVVVNHYDPFERGSEAGTLEEATEDLSRQVRRGNPQLQVERGSERRETLDGARARSLVLSGRSPATGEQERVTVFTRELADGHVLYALFVAPAAQYPELQRTFDRMVSSLRVDDRAAHR
jgi:Zn-dependent protease with chaperone function